MAGAGAGMAVLPETEADLNDAVLFCPTHSPTKFLAFFNDVLLYILVALPLLRFLSFVFTPVLVSHCFGSLIASLVY